MQCPTLCLSMCFCWPIHFVGWSWAPSSADILFDLTLCIVSWVRKLISKYFGGALYSRTSFIRAHKLRNGKVKKPLACNVWYWFCSRQNKIDEMLCLAKIWVFLWNSAVRERVVRSNKFSIAWGRGHVVVISQRQSLAQRLHKDSGRKRNEKLQFCDCWCQKVSR